MKNNKLNLYDIKTVKKLFTENNIIAYGNGSFFEKIKSYLDLFHLNFSDVLYTKDEQIISISGKSYESFEKDSIILICSSFYNEIINFLNDKNIKVQNIIIAIFDNTEDKKINIFKKELSDAMKIRHKQLLQNLKNKEKIKVVFLAIEKSVWKLDPLFKKMIEDKYFDPIILVVPYKHYGEERMWKDLDKTYKYFKSKNYPVLNSFDKINNKWIKLKDLGTDIVFFTVPHEITYKEYYDDAYLNFLSCYTGYGVNVAALRGLIQFNQIFHNAQWINFANSKFVLNCYKQYSANQGENALLVGDMTCELLLSKATQKDPWKNNKRRLRIIYAPHHSITSNNEFNYRLSTFLDTANKIQQLAIKYKDQATWAFKPHPILKSKLYNHIDWGKEKTDKYYNFWENNDFTQLEEGEYIDLFKNSDALIHDSASFLYEYLTLKKPVLFLTHSSIENSLNEQGSRALNACYKAITFLEIENFIKKLINKELLIKKSMKTFLKMILKIYL